MKWVDKTQKIPIKSWVEKLEDEALKQASNLANLPFAFSHIALMPDAHPGYGMPIGGVLATKDTVVPNAVGVDIGCGMSFLQTNIPTEIIDQRLLRNIVETIKRNIPVGFAHHKHPQMSSLLDSLTEEASKIEIITTELENAKYSLGTLGSGNHFLELQSDQQDHLCLMLHSGSRNFGYKVANNYNEKAKELGNMIDEKWDLAFLSTDSKEGQEYITAMNFALDFAKENRQHMFEKMKSIVFNLLNKHTSFQGIETARETNIHHNYASYEEHQGEFVWVHRKGAIRVEKGTIGIIPGSMGTLSYIVEGKGNQDSFNSASHGAGRKMGRGQFNRTHTLEEVNKAMEGIEFLGWSKGRKGKLDLSEAPQAYKNIDEVIAAENDLIEVVLKLRPIGVIKG